MEEKVDFDVLPCGCTIERVIVDGVRTLKMAPCGLNCENYLYAINQGQSKGLSINYREL